MSDKEQEKQKGSREAPDPFDPAALRLGQNFGVEVGVKKVLLKVPVRKPSKQEFVRVRSGEAYRLDTAVIELKEEQQTTFLISPDLRGELFQEILPVRLHTTINRQGVVAIWPCKLPGPDGRSNPWYETALQAAELAQTRWVRVVADMSLGGYQTYVASEALPDPEWPELSFGELLKLAFGDQYITSLDHPVVKRLKGLV